jgi:hypothetical protein
MSVQERIASLRERHSSVDIKLHDEEKRPLPNSSTIHKLKREKLRLKDQIDRMGQETP